MLADQSVTSLPRRRAGGPPAPEAEPDRLVIDDCRGTSPQTVLGTRWMGFSDRVMGGVSTCRLVRDVVGGRPCIRLRGQVTRDHGGGFVQMALGFASAGEAFDASAYRGIELLVHGNDERYNVHIRTTDVLWYEQSYRLTFTAPSSWHRLRLAWADFVPHGLRTPLNTAGLVRIGLLGWMREFEVDLALGEIALYR